MIDLNDPEAEETNKEVSLVELNKSQDSDDAKEITSNHEPTRNGSNTKVQHDSKQEDTEGMQG